MPTPAPPLSPARGPPQHDLAFDSDPGFDLDQTPDYDLTEPEPVPDFDFDQSADGIPIPRVRFETAGTSGVTAWCLEPHDLWVSKAIAGRPKDLEFCRALIERGLVERDRLRERLAQVDALDARIRRAVLARIPA
jgi:hypothetical protein